MTGKNRRALGTSPSGSKTAGNLVLQQEHRVKPFGEQHMRLIDYLVEQAVKDWLANNGS